MKKVGITGQSGFVGKHLYNTLGLYPNEFQRVPFQKEFFEQEEKLDAFVNECDVIVHLAAMNRHPDPEVIYQTNIDLAEALAQSVKRTGKTLHILFSSSSQEERDNLYGKSKREGRELLHRCQQQAGGLFTGMVIPNVFGPFGLPFYNSVVATFCHQLAADDEPVIHTDGELNLIYVGELVQVIIDEIRKEKSAPYLEVQPTAHARVSEILSTLKTFKEQYQGKGIIPELDSSFDLNLFNTYRCYMPLQNHFPVAYVQHTDPRGAFVEVIRLNQGGQVSFSTTVPGITRGNHFHTRKIERFSVIKGSARIQLRQIGTDQVLNFELSGDKPAYVDMPIWYTHNITNIGSDDLYTIFWINEFYNPEDPDTFFEDVEISTD